MSPLYLDFNASTPLDQRVFEAMRPWMTENPGNAGSRTHLFGKNARDAIEEARKQVATVLKAGPEEIVFTSGATESNNIALLGLAAFGEAENRKHILSTAIEHKAVLEPLEHLQSIGFDVELLPVGSAGHVDADDIRNRLRSDTLLVSVMHANNETGIVQPIVEIAEAVTDSHAFFHIDAAQTFGKDVESLQNLNVDLVSVSGHKIYGPTGIGVLVARRKNYRRPPLTPLQHGGGQERGLRPGTLPVPLIVGLGRAAEIALDEHRERDAAARSVREAFFADIANLDYAINGDESRSQPHVVNLSFSGVDGEALMMALRDTLAISNGSACTSESYTPSHVLTAMGLGEDRCESAVRISWGAGIERIPSAPLIAAVEDLRAHA